ncbi:MAG: hypothetical protein GY906_22295 [bacterium]|nr:hypothetical protein [bacterium]
MTRAQALMILLAAPVVASARFIAQNTQADSSGIELNPEYRAPIVVSGPNAKPSALGLHIELGDTPSDISFLSVSYNGESKRFSAKEIWEALNENDI